MEHYIETAVPRKNKLKDYALCLVCCMIPMLIGTYLVILMYSIKDTMLLGLSVVVCALLYYLAYKIFNTFNVDWEYTLVSDEIRFSKIINKSKRRDITTVTLSKIEKVARVTDKEHTSILNTRFDAKYTFLSQMNDDYYFLVGFDKNGKRICIFFEPDDRLCENFKTTLRGKFFE